MHTIFAWRYFKAKKKAGAINIIAWVTISVIAFATACQILVLSVFNGFEDLVKSLYSSFYPAIKISPENGKTIHFSAAQQQFLSKQQSIESFSMVVEEKALMQHGDLQTIVKLKGVDPFYQDINGINQKVVQGKYEIGTTENPCLVVGAGVQYASAVDVEGASPASVVTLILPKRMPVTTSDPMKSLSEGVAKVSGVFSIQQEFDNQYVLTNLTFIKQQMGFDPNEYSGIEVRVKSGHDPKQVKAFLQQALGSKYKIQTKYEQNSSLYNTMKNEKWVIYAILTLILLVAAFNMISALTMLVLEKQKDTNVLRSLGASNGLILKIFLSEGILLGVIGTISGILLATIICVLQLKYKLIKLQGGSFLINYFPVKLNVIDFLLVAATAMFIVLLASWLPSQKAAKQPLELKS